MKDKKQRGRAFVCGIALSFGLCILASGAVLYLSETFIRSGIADMAGAVGSAAPGSLEISCIYTSPVMALRVQGRKS